MKLIINILLWAFSIVATIVLFFVGVAHAIIDAIRFGSFNRRINYYFLSTATAIDIMANTMFSNMLNAWFLRKKGYHFGKRGETISSALGKNECIDGLTWMGRGLASILNLLDTNHCYNAIDDPTYKLVYKEPNNKVSKWITIVSFIIVAVLFYSLIKILMFIF